VLDATRCRVTKVRQFQKLALMSAGDGQLQQRLKQLLKLSKEKWDSACEHAKTAVQVGFALAVRSEHCLAAATLGAMWRRPQAACRRAAWPLK
jgi:hypothetical protein